MSDQNSPSLLEAASPRPSISVGEFEYKLHFDLNATVAMKQKTGVNLQRDGVDLTDPELLRAALYCALLRNHPDMTEAWAGTLVDIENISDVRLKLFEAITASRPKQIGIEPADSSQNPPIA